VCRAAHGLAKLVLVLLALLGSGPLPTASAEGAAGSPSSAEIAPGDPCFEVPAVVRYLHAMQDRILDAWKLPEDGLANRSVVLSLRVDGDGTLLKYELVSYSNRRLARSVKLAVMAASPFEPLPIEALCLRGRDIQTTFGNPVPTD
jgi:hypothetical protein